VVIIWILEHDGRELIYKFKDIDTILSGLHVTAVWLGNHVLRDILHYLRGNSMLSGAAVASGKGITCYYGASI
jgi:hypothetical protein